MPFFQTTALLLVTLLALSTYRYGFIAQLLDGDGYSGMTIFSILLFLPALTAFLWKKAGEDKRAVWTVVSIAAVLFLGTPLAGRPFSKPIVLANALAFGFADAWLVPAFQRYFQRAGGTWLSWGMATVFGVSGISVLLSPTLYGYLGAPRLAWTSLIATSGLCLLIANLIPALSEAAEARATTEAPIVESPSSPGTSAALFLAGLGFGSIANMIYPIAMKMLHLGPIGVGFYACLPLTAFAVGSALQGAARGRWRKEFTLISLLLPTLFFSERINIFLILFTWGASLSFAEVAALYEQKNFQKALSLKYFGIALGILVTGEIANTGISTPLGAVALGFYLVGSVGGLYLWAKSWSIKTTPAGKASLTL